VTHEKTLQDIEIREEQLGRYIIRSEGYLTRFHSEFRRQVQILYLSIILLILFQSLFAWQFTHYLSGGQLVLVVATTLLAIVNCALLIRTKGWLRSVNEEWIDPEEKAALETIRKQRHQVLKELTFSH
jgi:hypothetical protein